MEVELGRMLEGKHLPNSQNGLQRSIQIFETDESCCPPALAGFEENARGMGPWTRILRAAQIIQTDLISSGEIRFTQLDFADMLEDLTHQPTWNRVTDAKQRELRTMIEDVRQSGKWVRCLPVSVFPNAPEFDRLVGYHMQQLALDVLKRVRDKGRSVVVANIAVGRSGHAAVLELVKISENECRIRCFEPAGFMGRRYTGTEKRKYEALPASGVIDPTEYGTEILHQKSFGIFSGVAKFDPLAENNTSLNMFTLAQLLRSRGDIIRPPENSQVDSDVFPGAAVADTNAQFGAIRPWVQLLNSVTSVRPLSVFFEQMPMAIQKYGVCQHKSLLRYLSSDMQRPLYRAIRRYAIERALSNIRKKDLTSQWEKNPNKRGSVDAATSCAEALESYIEEKLSKS